MPCEKCGECLENKEANTMCDVCRLVDRNWSEKHCIYCCKCKAWICDECRPNTPKRALAMLLSCFEKS